MYSFLSKCFMLYKWISASHQINFYLFYKLINCWKLNMSLLSRTIFCVAVFSSYSLLFPLDWYRSRDPLYPLHRFFNYHPQPYFVAIFMLLLLQSNIFRKLSRIFQLNQVISDFKTVVISLMAHWLVRTIFFILPLNVQIFR